MQNTFKCKCLLKDFCFETGFSLYPWLALYSETSVCFCLPSAGARGVCHHTRLVYFFYMHNLKNQSLYLLPSSFPGFLSRIPLISCRCFLFDKPVFLLDRQQEHLSASLFSVLSSFHVTLGFLICFCLSFLI